jgi:hypothetical protein
MHVSKQGERKSEKNRKRDAKNISKFKRTGKKISKRESKIYVMKLVRNTETERKRKQRKTEKGRKEKKQVDISLPTFTPKRCNAGK